MDTQKVSPMKENEEMTESNGGTHKDRGKNQFNSIPEIDREEMYWGSYLYLEKHKRSLQNQLQGMETTERELMIKSRLVVPWRVEAGRIYEHGERNN